MIRSLDDIAKVETTIIPFDAICWLASQYRPHLPAKPKINKWQAAFSPAVTKQVIPTGQKPSDTEQQRLWHHQRGGLAAGSGQDRATVRNDRCRRRRDA
jgi:hypothetical protein